MTFLLAAIVVVIYLLIGSIFAGFVQDEDLDAAAIFFWPLVLFMFLAIFSFDVVRKLGYFLADTINNFIHKGEQNNENQEENE